MKATDDKGDWAGWTIQLKNRTPPMYAQAELQCGLVAWTTGIDNALGFKKKRDAVAFLERNGETLAGCDLRFHPWRRSQTVNEGQS